MKKTFSSIFWTFLATTNKSAVSSSLRSVNLSATLLGQIRTSGILQSLENDIKGKILFLILKK